MRRTLISVLILFLALGISIKAFASPKVATFDGSPDEVFNAAVLAAQKDWKVTQTDRATRTLSFVTRVSVRTWGMDCTVLITEIPGGKTQVTLRTVMKYQIYAWGAGDSIAKEYFATIEDELSKAKAAAKASTTLKTTSSN